VKITRTILIVLIAALFVGSAAQKSTPSCRDIVEHMLDSIKNIRTQSCSVKATERIGKRFLIAQSYIKINVSPRKIYFHSPEKGAELLWVEGSNKGNAIVHSKSL